MNTYTCSLLVKPFQPIETVMFPAAIRILVVLSFAGQLAAQSPDTGQWRKAIRTMGTVDEAKLVETRQILIEALKARDRHEVQACGLVLLYIHQQRLSDAGRALSGIATTFPNSSPSTKNFIARIELVLALADTATPSNKEAEARYRNLARLSFDESTPKAEKILNFALLGTVHGMLCRQEAGSPVSDTTREKLEELLTAPEYRTVFDARKARAQEQAEGYVQIIDRLEQSPVAVRATILKEVEQEITDKEKAQQQLEADLDSKHKSQVVERKQINAELRSLKGIVNQLQAAAKQPTPGRPTEPKDYTERTETVRVGGNRTETTYEKVGSMGGLDVLQRRTREVKGDTPEREEKRTVRVRKSPEQYRSEMAQYQVDLQHWQEADRQRRAQLNSQLIQANQQLVPQQNKLTQLDNERREQLKSQAESRATVDSARQLLLMHQQVVKALEAKQTELLFRFPRFAPLDVTAESNRLLAKSR